MRDPTDGFDPRTRVTPDALKVSGGVLGLPLASPARRLFAFAVDGIGVGLLTLLDWRILGVLAAFAFFRLATRKETTNRVGRTFQYSLGCAGALLLLAVFIVSTGVVGRVLTTFLAPESPAGTEVVESDLGVLGAIRGVGEAVEFLSAEDEAEAEEAGLALVRRMVRLESVDTAGALSALGDLAGEEAPWDRDVVLARITERFLGEPPQVRPVDTIPLGEALVDYGDLAGPEPDTGWSAAELERRTVLERRIAAAVATDTIDLLGQRIAALEEDLEGSRQETRAAERRASEAEEDRGLFAWFMGTFDQLGLTFGWGAIYFATFMSLMHGQTPGKRLLGVRVVRLSGEPLGWFLAFERTGGYAAGVATGLLGFAQLLWDPNRQAIHDKIAGTVVVRVNRPTRPDTESAGSETVPPAGATGAAERHDPGEARSKARSSKVTPDPTDSEEPREPPAASR
jgi:hypothetical protein